MVVMKPKNWDIPRFGNHPPPRQKVIDEAEFGAGEPPREAMYLAGCIPQDGRLGYS
jgi:hypothetical protein